MNRRATLATLIGQKKEHAAKRNTTASRVLSGLEPYSGSWNFEQAAHLLRRTTFGATYAQVKDAVNAGLNSIVTMLLEDQPMPGPPLNYYFQNDPNVPVGETWIDAPYSLTVQLKQYRTRSLAGWTMEQLLNKGVSITEQMVLFWHNHFVISDVNDPKFVYRYIITIREQALGNFRQLTKDITIDPAMLRYLNGNQNTKLAPNENYARELLELFTIGKGPVAGPGDYTNYTEDDVVEIARILTGWRDTGFNDLQGNPVGAQFISFFHDEGDKQLSHRFDDLVITNAGENEYAQLIDIIFQKSEVARFISRKLYRWFVYYEIDDIIEQNVIEPMAQVLMDNDFEVKPLLEVLFKSQHFYDIQSLGCVIKNPIYFVMNVVNQLEAPVPSELSPRYAALFQLYNQSALMQMQYYLPPSVAGWKAYYQEPLFYRSWINSVTLPERMKYTDTLSTNGLFVALGVDRLKVDVLSFIQTIDNPLDPNAVIDEFTAILFPQPITQDQKDYLKEVLIPGLPDFEWTVEYSEYLADPSNSDLAESVENKLRTLIRTMLSMPEFYLG